MSCSHQAMPCSRLYVPRKKVKSSNIDENTSVVMLFTPVHRERAGRQQVFPLN